MTHIDLGSQAWSEPLGELFSALQFGVVVCDLRLPDAPIVQANAAFERMTGYRLGDIVGRNCRFLQGEGTSPLVGKIMRDAIATGDPVTVTALNYRSDGSSFWNEIQLAPLAAAGDTVTHYVGLMRDVSERVDAERDLAHAEILRATAFNSMADGVLVLDSTGTVSDANVSALRILGASREDLANGDWWSRLDLRHPDGRPLTTAESPGLRAFRTRTPVLNARLLMRRHDGVDRIVSLNYEPLPGGTDAHPQGLVVSFSDVTDRERSQVDLQQFETLVEISGDFIAIAALDGTVTYVNPAGRRLVGLDSAERARGTRIRDFLTDEGWRASTRVEQPAVREHGFWQGEGTLRHFTTGEAIPVRISSYLVRHPETHAPVALATVQHDVSEEARVTADLVRSRERYEAQFRSLPVPTYVWRREDDDFVLMEWNAAAERASRGGIERYAGARASEMHADAPEVTEALERCWATRSQESREQTYRMRSTDEVRQMVVTYASVPPDLVLVHTLDITQRVQSERQLLRLAEEDDLTGLHNRRYFERKLADALGSRPVAVVFVDIDHFKFVNDSFGHDAGDELLREAAELMSARMRTDDVLARFGGDEFAVLLEHRDEDQVAAAAQHLLAAIRANVSRTSVTASAGAAIFPADASVSVSDAIVAADIALYAAKQQGRDRLEFYRGMAGESLAWVQQIREAIAHDRLTLVGQRIVDLHDPGAPPAYELLVRMLTDTGKMLPPSAFLPTAEQFGLMRDLDRWVIERAIAIAARGHRVGINLSARSIGDPGLPDRIGALIESAGARPQDITFEFTETAAISSLPDARTFTETLNEMGCTVALDDFGTGFGTFMLLKYLPVRYLKIDREFVRRLSTDAADQRIVRLIVHIAEEAGMRTVAEGVEDAGALALLREYGVDSAQGYHIARPGPLPEIDGD